MPNIPTNPGILRSNRSTTCLRRQERRAAMHARLRDDTSSVRRTRSCGGYRRSGNFAEVPTLNLPPPYCGEQAASDQPDYHLNQERLPEQGEGIENVDAVGDLPEPDNAPFQSTTAAAVARESLSAHLTVSATTATENTATDPSVFVDEVPQPTATEISETQSNSNEPPPSYDTATNNPPPIYSIRGPRLSAIERPHGETMELTTVPVWSLDDGGGGGDGDMMLRQTRDADMEARGDGWDLMLGWDRLDWIKCMGFGVVVVCVCVSACLWWWCI